MIWFLPGGRRQFDRDCKVLLTCICALLTSLTPVAPCAAAPVDLNLISTSTTTTAAHILHNATAMINVGGHALTVTPSSLLTPAEKAAVYQVVNSGHQSILLGLQGNAVGGSVTIGSHLAQHLSSLVVPQAVTVIDKAASLNIAGNLTNSGSLYAVSTNSAVHTASISAVNISNLAGGLISSVIPTGGLPGITGAVSNLNLALNAASDFVNSGTISSAGSINVSAGGSITNNAAALMAAANNVTLSSQTGSFINSGVIAAQVGNVNINTGTQLAQNITTQNAGGTIAALNGLINVRDSSYAGGANTNLLGGDFLSRQLNVYSGSGGVSADVGQITGNLNIVAEQAHVLADTPTLYLGNQCITGDPTYANTGNIVINSSLNFDGSLAIIAGGSITDAAGGTIFPATSSLNVTLIAGAHIVSSGVPSQPSVNTNGSGQPVSVPVTFQFDQTVSGGNITLSNLSGIQTGGGNLTMIAYGGNSSSGTGFISLGSVQITTGTLQGSGNGGNVLMIASGPALPPSSSADLISGSGQISTVSLNHSGNVVMATSYYPLINGASSGRATFNTDGTTTATFSPSVIAITGFSNENIHWQNTINTSTFNTSAGTVGGNVTLAANGNITLSSAGTYTIDTQAGTRAGSITLASANGLAVDTYAPATKWNFSAATPGSLTFISNANITSSVGINTATTASGTTSTGGNVTLLSGANFLYLGGVLTVTGASPGGGSINLGSNTVTTSSTNGAGGNIVLASLSGGSLAEGVLTTTGGTNGGNITLAGGSFGAVGTYNANGNASSGTGGTLTLGSSGSDLNLDLFTGSTNSGFNGGSLVGVSGSNVTGSTFSVSTSASGAGTAGNILLAASTSFEIVVAPGVTGASVVLGGSSGTAGNVNLTTGAGNVYANSTSGNGGAVALVANDGQITAANVVTSGANGGSVTLAASGGFASVPTISVTGALSGSGTSGNLTIATGTAISVGSLLAGYSSGAANRGNLTLVSSGNISSTSTNIVLSTVSSGAHGGNATLIAGDNFAFIGNAIGTGGAIKLVGVNGNGGNIALGANTINTSSSAGQAGNISLVANAGTVNAGSVATGALTANGSTSGGNVTLAGASIAFPVSINTSASGATGLGGTITLATTANLVIDNFYSSLNFSGASSGSLEFISSSNVTSTATNISTATSASGTGSAAGTVTIVSGTNFVWTGNSNGINGTLAFTGTSNSGAGGNINLGSNSITASSTNGAGGAIALVAYGTNQTITTGNIVSTGGTGGGAVTISAPGAVSVNSIAADATSSGNGGNVTINSGGLLTIAGRTQALQASIETVPISGSGNAGAITLNAAGGINIDQTNSSFILAGTSGSGKGGAITMTVNGNSSTGIVLGGDINSYGGQGGAVTLTASGLISTQSVISSGSSGSGGSVTITAGSTATVGGSIDAHQTSQNNVGGSVSIAANGNIQVQGGVRSTSIDTRGSNAGAITLVNTCPNCSITVAGGINASNNSVGSGNGGAVSIVSGSTINAASISSLPGTAGSAGAVMLLTPQAITLNASSTITGGNIGIVSGTSISLGTSGSITAEGTGNIYLSAPNTTGTGGITVGSITWQAGGSLLMTTATAGTSSSNLTITNLSGQTTFSPAGGVFGQGGNGAIAVSSTLPAQPFTTLPGVYLNSSGTVATITPILLPGGGLIGFSNAGTVFLGNDANSITGFSFNNLVPFLITGGSGSLAAAGSLGAISDTNAGNPGAGTANFTLLASSVTTSGNPININVGETLSMFAPINTSSSTSNAGAVMLVSGSSVYLQSINASSSFASGSGANVFIAAGVTNSYNSTTGEITLSGQPPSFTGGSISLMNLGSIAAVNTQSTATNGGSGGNVSLLALSGNASGSGQIQIAGVQELPGTIETAGTVGNGTVTNVFNGNVTIVANAASSSSSGNNTGYTITTGDITTGTSTSPAPSGGFVTGGNIFIQTASGNFSIPAIPEIVVDGSGVGILATPHTGSGTILLGDLRGGSPADGAIATGNLATPDAFVLLMGGSNGAGTAANAISTGSITTMSILIKSIKLLVTGRWGSCRLPPAITMAQAILAGTTLR